MPNRSLMATSAYHTHSILISGTAPGKAPPGTVQIECQDGIVLRLNPISAFDAGCWPGSTRHSNFEPAGQPSEPQWIRQPCRQINSGLREMSAQLGGESQADTRSAILGQPERDTHENQGE